MKNLLAGLLLPALFASTAIAQEKLRAFTLCRNGNIVRTIRVEPDGDRFVAIYTKNGIDRQVGRGIHEASIRKILQNIQANLEKAGWQCKEVNQSTIIESESKEKS